VAPLVSATPEQLGFLAHRRYAGDLARSHAGALLVAAELQELVASDGRPRLVVPDAYLALAILLDAFHPDEGTEGEVHPTAVFGRGARLGHGVRVGPYAVVEEEAVVGDGVTIGAHVVVGARSEVGSGSVLHPHCVLYPGTVLGERVIVHSGARLGVDGFGYVQHEGMHRKVPQVGSCVIEADVEIGANTTVDRGSIGETRIGQGTKLDNLVHLGHNVKVGSRAILAGQAGVGGSSTIGAGALVGGQVGIGGHINVGDGARLAGQAGVIGDVAPGETLMGFPARPRGEFLRATAAQARVPALLRRLRRIEESVASTDEKGGTSGKG
jgi:UDP-3-O-[3-hydroxymyristoyl] glucosamine N-acyltransferase